MPASGTVELAVSFALGDDDLGEGLRRIADAVAEG